MSASQPDTDWQCSFIRCHGRDFTPSTGPAAFMLPGNRNNYFIKDGRDMLKDSVKADRFMKLLMYLRNSFTRTNYEEIIIFAFATSYASSYLILSDKADVSALVVRRINGKYYALFPPNSLTTSDDCP